MKREAQRLDGHFDVLVIGGGIYGAWIAYDAALRGLSVAVVERDDWASGTSSASSKLIHGGLRYLEYGDIGLVSKALRERGRLLRLGPHRVRGLRFILPQYRDSRMPRLPMLAGLWLYDQLAGARPDLPAHRVHAASELIAHAPFIQRAGLIGGWSYPDAGEDDARMVLEIVAGSLTAGAVAVNHCAALRLLRANGRIAGAVVRDALTGRECEVRATTVIDAAGAWAAQAAGLTSLPARYSKGVHLLMPGLSINEAFLLTTRSDKRVFFLIPWYGSTLVGTTDTDFHGDPDSVRVEDADIDYLLAAVRDNCPGLGWNRSHVRGSFAGLRTMRGAPGTPSSISREWELLEPEAGLLLPLGGKFTSARVEAAHTVDRLRRGSHPTAQRAFPWKPSGPWPAWRDRATADGRALGLDAETARHAAERFAATLPLLHARLRSDSTLAQRIVAHAPFCWAEVPHAAAHEQAHTLRDILRRRIPLTILSPITSALAQRTADLAGDVLNWSPERRVSEAASVTTPYG